MKEKLTQLQLQKIATPIHDLSKIIKSLYGIGKYHKGRLRIQIKRAKSLLEEIEEEIK